MVALIHTSWVSEKIQWFKEYKEYFPNLRSQLLSSNKFPILVSLESFLQAWEMLRRYLNTTLSIDWKAPLFMGVKRLIKAGAALYVGLEDVPAGISRQLAGRYLLYACFQLDTLVDNFQDVSLTDYVRRWVDDCISGSHSLQSLLSNIMFNDRFSLEERLKLSFLLWNLHWLLKSTKKALVEPLRINYFLQCLSLLVHAVMDDVLEVDEHLTLSSLATRYPAMGLSSITVLWLLQGYSLNEIDSCQSILALGEQLARLEDDILEVWQAVQTGETWETRVDRRNLLLNHARSLNKPMMATLEDAYLVASRIEQQILCELDGFTSSQLFPDLRRVVTFFPLFVDKLIGRHRQLLQSCRNEALGEQQLQKFLSIEPTGFASSKSWSVQPTLADDN